MIPSSVASSEPPLTVTPTLEVSETATAVVVALLPLVTSSEPQGQATTIASALPHANPAIESTEQTQTASPQLLVIEGPTAQSSGSEDDVAQF